LIINKYYDNHTMSMNINMNKLVVSIAIWHTIELYKNEYHYNY